MVSAGPGFVDFEGNLLLPALGIPVREKERFECPAHHVEVLEETIDSGRVSRVVVIGWRGGEKLFLKVLARLPVGIPVDIVSGRRDEEETVPKGALDTHRNLTGGGLKGDFAFLPGGFSELIRLSAAHGSLIEHSKFTSFDEA